MRVRVSVRVWGGKRIPELPTTLSLLSTTGEGEVGEVGGWVGDLSKN